jgi:MFS transporter, DHA2 family, multidrug resistance protein
MAATPTEATSDAAPLKPLHGGPLALLTIAVAFSTFMEVLDMTIVNVAVPHIAGSLGVSPAKAPGRSARTRWPARSCSR